MKRITAVVEVDLEPSWMLSDVIADVERHIRFFYPHFQASITTESTADLDALLEQPRFLRRAKFNLEVTVNETDGITATLQKLFDYNRAKLSAVVKVNGKGADVEEPQLAPELMALLGEEVPPSMEDLLGEPSLDDLLS